MLVIIIYKWKYVLFTLTNSNKLGITFSYIKYNELSDYYYNLSSVVI